MDRSPSLQIRRFVGSCSARLQPAGDDVHEHCNSRTDALLLIHGCEEIQNDMLARLLP
jgi:hypothetical protein